jgi:tripartite-type tricarboxylate transporter receptor subunit TctC
VRSRFFSRRRLAFGIASLVTVGALVGCSGVQNGGGGDDVDPDAYPSRAIELVVGSSAGGSTDLLARALATAVEPAIGERVGVINLPGANGGLAMQDVQTRTPDGLTLMLAPASLFTITPIFVAESEAMSLDDVQIVTGVGREEYVLVTNKASGFTSIDDLAAAGRNINYATAGVGTGGQLSQALLFDALDIPATDVPFDGGALAVTALLGNQVDVASVSLLEASAYLESGDFVPLATFGSERSEYFDEVATATEQGYDVVVTQSRFIVVPLDTPDAIVEKIVAAFQAAFDDADYQAFLEESFIAPDETDAEETKANLLEAKERYAAAAEAAGLGG